MTNPKNQLTAEIIYHDKRYGSEWGKLDYATSGSAALDLRACVASEVVINPGETYMVSSGISIHLKNPNFMMNLHPRSGLGAKQGIVLGNLTGIIDSDYTGEMGIPLWNRGKHPFTIEPGARVAQLIVVPIYHLDLIEVEEFSSSTERGAGGFGHSGTK